MTKPTNRKVCKVRLTLGKLFLYVDLREKNSDSGSAGVGGIENDQLTGYFQSFFFVIFRAFKSKTSEGKPTV